jgi:hypothetical protein
VHLRRQRRGGASALEGLRRRSEVRQAVGGLQRGSIGPCEFAQGTRGPSRRPEEGLRPLGSTGDPLDPRATFLAGVTYTSHTTFYSITSLFEARNMESAGSRPLEMG